jgi:uncharacterized protein YciI
MKVVAFFLGILLYSVSAPAQTTNPNYNAELAKKLGADAYGMKSYVFVLLKTGTNTSTDEAARNKAFAGHMQNMKRMQDAGQLVVAGPMGTNDKEYRGIFILNVATVEEAKELLQTDPAIAANYLKAEVLEWYGSAALPKYLEAHDKIWTNGL